MRADSIHTICCKLSIILYYQISWVTLYSQTTHTTYGQSHDFQSMWSEEKLNKEMLLRLKAEKKKIDILWMRLSLWHFFFTCMTFETSPRTSLNASLNCTPNNQPVLLAIFSHKHSYCTWQEFLYLESLGQGAVTRRMWIEPPFYSNIIAQSIFCNHTRTLASSAIIPPKKKNQIYGLSFRTLPANVKKWDPSTWV